MTNMNRDKRLARPALSLDGPPDGRPDGASACARRWLPRQWVFGLRPAHPLDWPAPGALGLFWQVLFEGWRARSVLLSCPGALPCPFFE